MVSRADESAGEQINMKANVRRWLAVNVNVLSLLKAIVYVTNATNNVIKHPFSISFIHIISG